MIYKVEYSKAADKTSTSPLTTVLYMTFTTNE